MKVKGLRNIVHMGPRVEEGYVPSGWVPRGTPTGGKF